MENKTLCSINIYKLDINRYHNLNCDKNDIIPKYIKTALELLFNKQLNVFVQFSVKFGNNRYYLDDYYIIIKYQNNIIAKSNRYLKLIDETINIDELKQNYIKHKLLFTFNKDKTKSIVNRYMEPSYGPNILCINLKTIINEYNLKNKNKLYNAILLKTCEDVTNKIFSYVSE